MAAPKTTTIPPERRAEIIKHVLQEVAGGRAVSRILREDAGMPCRSTWWNWYFSDQNLVDKVALARANGVESIVDEALDIADTPEIGKVETDDGEKVVVRTEDMLGHRKLRVETRLKYAQMIAPRKYGSKIDLTTGGDPLNIQIVRHADDPHPE